MTFHENFVNWQFVDILHEKSFSNTKSRPLMTFLMVSDRHDVIVTFKDNIVNFFTQNYIRPQIILNELEPFYHFRIWICFKINHKNGIFIVKAWFLVLTFKKVWVRKRRKVTCIGLIIKTKSSSFPQFLCFDSFYRKFAACLVLLLHLSCKILGLLELLDHFFGWPNFASRFDLQV